MKTSFRFIAAMLLALPGAAAAQTFPDISTEIAETGLQATHERLLASGSTDPGDLFALGGITFLRTIEATLQTRWRTAMDTADLPIPVLRLPIPPNPTPEPFRPELVTEIFSDVISGMTEARASLDRIDPLADFAVTIDLGDLWFDVDMDGARGPGEGVIEVAGAALGAGQIPGGGDMILPTIRFDAADASWLAAYTHLLSGAGELVLAFDPTETIRSVQDASAKISEFHSGPIDVFGMRITFGPTADMLAMVYFSLRAEPDPAHTHAARQHLLGMIERNRAFWEAVARETDNNAEWVPNDRQTSALGIALPPDTRETWLAVLADAEAVLNGEKLIRHWRLGEGAGINLMRLFEDPPPVDIPAWAHGIGLLDYFEKGELVSGDSWQRFLLMAEGDAVMFMVFLN